VYTTLPTEVYFNYQIFKEWKSAYILLGRIISKAFLFITVINENDSNPFDEWLVAVFAQMKTNVELSMIPILLIQSFLQL
jgi:hypothetical protein